MRTHATGAMWMSFMLAVAAPAGPVVHQHPMGSPLPTANWPTWAVMTIFVVLVLIAVVTIKVIKHLRLLGHDDSADTRSTFVLVDLRRLRDAGQISDVEYAALRETLRRREMTEAEKKQDEDTGRLR